MKKTIALILSLIMVGCTVAACGSAKSTASSETTTAETTTAAETTAAETTAAETTAAETTAEETTEAETESLGETTGGWTITEDDFSAAVDADAEEALEAALENYTGMTFEPIALLGTQVVAGTNYMILCRGTAVVPDAEPALKVVTVYAGVDGSREILDVEDFDLSVLEESDTEATEQGLAGGWTYAELPVADYDAEAEQAFSAATEELLGAEYDVSAVLGTKVTNGTEYAFLCNMTTVTAEPATSIVVVFVNAAADGTSELIKVADIDLASYCEQ